MRRQQAAWDVKSRPLTRLDVQYCRPACPLSWAHAAPPTDEFSICYKVLSFIERLLRADDQLRQFEIYRGACSFSGHSSSPYKIGKMLSINRQQPVRLRTGLDRARSARRLGGWSAGQSAIGLAWCGGYTRP